jgi:Protein of unknown function (DUF2934)
MAKKKITPPVNVVYNNDENYHIIIAEIAYYKAENRGFEPGYELDDWLEAEQEYIVMKNL